MLSLNRILAPEDTAKTVVGDTLTIPFELRQRSRLRATLASGREAAVILPRGHILRGGTRLTDDDGAVVEVVAASEPVSEVRTSTPQSLARAAYHLGNRHVPLQVGDGFVRYLHDHVLDDMVRALGLTPTFAEAPFEPEAGAYGGGHRHSHDHDHGEH